MHGLSWHAECVLCAALGRGDISHHRPAQFLSLGSLLLWIPLTPAYYAAFAWNENTRRWRIAFLAGGRRWFSPAGSSFFPAFSTTSNSPTVWSATRCWPWPVLHPALLIFVLVQLLGEGGWIFNRTRSFYGWNLAVIGYVLLMTAAGWREGFDPTFTIVPGLARNTIYILRLVVGAVMLASSADWLIDATTLLGAPTKASATMEVNA